MRRSRYARYRWTRTYDNNNEPSSTPNLDKLLFRITMNKYYVSDIFTPTSSADINYIERK